MSSGLWAQAGASFSGKRSNGSSKPPIWLKYRSSKTFIVFTVCLAIFTDILFYGLVIPVLPFSLTVQVGIPEDQVQQWTAILLACYTAAVFVVSPFVGILADRMSSRRVPLILGLLALAGSTLLLCLGKTVALLVVGRLLQGLSAAIVWSVGLALLADTMGSNIGYAMGYVGMSMSFGYFVAPLIGGSVYAAAGYYPVYYVAFAFIFCDIVLRLALIERKVARQWLDEESGQGSTVPAGGLMPSDPDPNSEKSSEPNPTDEAVGRVQATSSKSAGFQDVAAHPPPADIPEVSASNRHPYVHLLTSSRLLAALFGAMLISGVVLACDTILPLFVKNTFGWNSTAAGLIFICIMVPGFFSPLAGMLSDRYGAKWPTLFGITALIPLLICLRFVSENTIGHKVLLCVLLTLLGSVHIFAMAPLLAEISYTIAAKQAEDPGVWGEQGVYGIAYGMFNLSFAMGGTVGSLMAGYVVAGPGWGTVTWALALWCAPGIPAIALWVGAKPSGKPKVTADEENANETRLATGGGNEATQRADES